VNAADSEMKDPDVGQGDWLVSASHAASEIERKIITKIKCPLDFGLSDIRLASSEPVAYKNRY